MRLGNLAAAVAVFTCAVSAAGADLFVYAGTFTAGESRGIYGYRFDTHTGRLKPLGLVNAVSNPTFLVVHPDHRFVYAVSQDPVGQVSAFLTDPKTGRLTLVNRVSTEGAAPSYLDLDRSGRWLAAANTASGSVAIFPLRADGGIGKPQISLLPAAPPANAGKPLDPRPTCVMFSPDNRYLLAADQGLDRVVVYRFDAQNGSLTSAAPQLVAAPPGTGIRRLAFHPNGRAVYAAGDMRAGVLVYRFVAASGELEEMQTISTVQASRDLSATPAEIAVNQAGSVVYASTGSADSVALLTADPLRSTLAVLEYTPLVGRKPSCFALDPTGAYLAVANLDSRGITIYTVHPHTGQLRPAGRPVPPLDRPAWLVFVPAE